MKETHIRSVAKTISWRIIATLTTTILVYVFTGNFLLTISVGSAEAVAKLIFYYFHERTWNHIAWGKVKA